jgi:hypothetical protein
VDGYAVMCLIKDEWFRGVGQRHYGMKRSKDDVEWRRHYREVREARLR